MRGWCKAIFMKKRRLLAAVLAVLLAVALPLPELTGQGEVQAAGNTAEIANVVVFVRFRDDTRDIFNATNGQTGINYRSNWQEIRNMYDLAPNSFSNYITAITEGKVHVANYFPQEHSGGQGVQTLTLPQSSVSGSPIVNEVAKALADGRISMGADTGKLDNVETGFLDNLTIIIQGDITDHPQNAAYRSTYAGTESFNGLRIGNVIELPSKELVAENTVNYARDQQAVIAHEFLHTLGLPDLYRKNGDGVPVGSWDIMASVGPAGLLQYPLSYLRYRQGWIPMKTITQSGTYTLTAVSQSGGDKLFVLRTPLSDSELICLEYRKKGSDSNEFEYPIPSSGLLIYRVDNKVEELSNQTGQNGIYVYRRGVTHPETADDTRDWAALDGTAGKTGYGTTDLSAGFEQNTLYYSDGSNSGIQISDVKLSSDGSRVTFTVTFADYSDSGVWDKLGDGLSGKPGGEADICVHPETGILYAAYTETIPGSADTSRIRVKAWNGTAWQQVGQAIDNAQEPALAVCGGELYLSYSNGSSAVYCKLNGGTWSQVRAYAAQYPRSMQLVTEGSDIYGVYQESCASGVRLVIRDIKSGQTVTDSLTTAFDFSNPALIKSGDSFYMVCSEFAMMGPGGPTQIREYNMSTGRWSVVYTIAEGLTSIHDIVKQGQKIYAFAGYSVPGASSKAYMAVFDGNSWGSSPVVSMNRFNTASMAVADGQLYLAYYDTAAGSARLLRGTGAAMEECGDKLGTKLDFLKICSKGNTLYAAVRAENTGTMVVRAKALAQGSEPVPEQKPRVLTLTPPAGYGNNAVWVDGVEYSAQRDGSSCQVELPDTLGRTAVMYSYDGKGIPVGMYVWKLEWQGESCSAVPLPGLQDLLSYHGFSIRVQSPAGIRFKSGIDENLKQRLVTEGVDGCLLKEYGTLFITNENRVTYPFVKGGTKVGGGRAYWTENGVVNDKVFETVAGRNRFTSVLINLAPNMYAKDIAFRAYAVLDCGGQEVIVYGPPVYRSVYTVAKQVQAKGEFKVGSSGYRYVQEIIDSVEGR